MAQLSREMAPCRVRQTLVAFAFKAQAQIEFVKHREKVDFRMEDSSEASARRIHGTVKRNGV
jgi:hypothetical protein